MSYNLNHIRMGTAVNWGSRYTWTCIFHRESGDRQAVLEIPAEVYLSSHARPLKEPYIKKRLHAFAAFFEKRDRQILDFLSQSPLMGIEDLVRLSPFYDADHASVSDELLWFGEEQMIRKHLEGLLGRALIVQEGELFRLA